MNDRKENMNRIFIKEYIVNYVEFLNVIYLALNKDFSIIYEALNNSF